LIADYRSRRLNISRILTLLKIPRSTHYHSPPSLQIRRGRKFSLITERITDSGIIAITDEQLLLDITDLLSREFVCYGYKKVTTKYLQRSGYIINRKKVFRILKENYLLYIESFNSILEKEVIRRFEFSSFEDAESTISKLIEFYNNERLRSALDCKRPREVYEKWKENIIEGPA
jgi:hypothetical protein